MASYTKYNPTWSLNTFLMLDGQGSILKAKGFPEFDPAVDWCGPENNERLASMIPDSIMGVPIGIAGYRHDLGYALPAKMRPKWCKNQYFWRLLCDRRFRSDIMTLLERAKLPKVDLLMAKKFARIYYWSVRFGGSKHCVH